MWETCPKLGSGWASAVHAEGRAVGLLLFEWHQGQRGALWVPLAQECWGGSRGSARLGRDPGDLFPILRWAMGAAGGCRCPGRCGAPGGLPLGGFVALQPWSKLVSSVPAPQPELCAPALEQGCLLVASVQAETRHGLSLKGCYWFYFILTSFREILSVLWVYWYVSIFAY